jgi:hypothetical protein
MKGTSNVASRNNDTVTISISLRNANDFDGNKKGIRSGTFEGPDPLVSVTPGTKLQWQITPANFDFTVTFHNVSPFPGVLSISKANGGTSNPLPVSILGHYHYSVTVTDGTKTWVISSCPELDVGDVS